MADSQLADSQPTVLLGVGLAAISASIFWGDSASVRALSTAVWTFFNQPPVVVVGVGALDLLQPYWCMRVRSKSMKEDGLAASPSVIAPVSAAVAKLKAASVALYHQKASMASFQVLAVCSGALLTWCAVKALGIPAYPWVCLLLGALCSWCVRHFGPVEQNEHLDDEHLDKLGIVGEQKPSDVDCPYQPDFWKDFPSISEQEEEDDSAGVVEDLYKMMPSSNEGGCQEEAAEEATEESDEEEGIADPFEIMREMGQESDGQVTLPAARVDQQEAGVKSVSKLLSVEVPEFVPRWAREETADQCSNAEPAAMPTHSTCEGVVNGIKRPWRVPGGTCAQSAEAPEHKPPWKSSFVGHQPPLHEAAATKVRPWKRTAVKPLMSEADDGEGCSDFHSRLPPLDQNCTMSCTASCATTETGASISSLQSDSFTSEDSAGEEASDDTDSQVEEQKVAVYQISDLLKWHASVGRDEPNGYLVDGRLTVEPAEFSTLSPKADTLNKTKWSSFTTTVASSSATLDSRSQKVVEQQKSCCLETAEQQPAEQRSEINCRADLQVSENSWAAKQRARRAQQAENADARTDEEVVRTMKGILNKLTIEKFPQLYQKMITCGIRTTDQLEQLIKEVFEKATTQHHFIDMYADLCSQLNSHFVKNPIGKDTDFKRILLNACQASFEKNLSSADFASLNPEEQSEAALVFKMRKLGNIRFIGALLVRKMLASKVMLVIAKELLREPTPEALETLAALLTVVGSEFDTPAFAYHEGLNAIFSKVESLAKSNTTHGRVRCLLKDVVDLRKASWLDKKPKQMEKPTTLEEVHQKASMEDTSPVNFARQRSVDYAIPSTKSNLDAWGFARQRSAPIQQWAGHRFDKD